PLGGERRGGHRPGALDLLDPAADQLRVDGLGVDLLHALGGLVVGQAGDLLVHRVRVLVPGPQALQVEYAETAEAAELDRDPGRDHPVHGRGEHGQAELVGVDLPGDVDVVRVAGGAGLPAGDVLQAVGATAALANPDLDLSQGSLHSKVAAAGARSTRVGKGCEATNRPTRQRATGPGRGAYLSVAMGFRQGKDGGPEAWQLPVPCDGWRCVCRHRKGPFFARLFFARLFFTRCPCPIPWIRLDSMTTTRLPLQSTTRSEVPFSRT